MHVYTHTHTHTHVYAHTHTVSENGDITSPSVEAVAVLLPQDAVTVRLRVLHRPPIAPNWTIFFSDFVDIIDQYSLMYGLLTLVDYNIH